MPYIEWKHQNNHKHEFVVFEEKSSKATHNYSETPKTMYNYSETNNRKNGEAIR